MIFKKKYNFNTLEEYLEFSWKMLDQGAKKFMHAFHCPVLVSEQANHPHVRTVILRDFSQAHRTLICYCDARSPKVEQIRNNSNVAWLFYDPKIKFQLRISGTAAVHTDDKVADNQWEQIRITSRINYTTLLKPGSNLEAPSSGLPEFITQTAPQLLDKNIGRNNFAVIVCRFFAMDALLLGLTGHKRARFGWEDDRLAASWVVP